MNSSETATKASPGWLRNLTALIGLASCAVLAWLAFDQTRQPPGNSGGFAQREPVPCQMDRAGYLRGNIYGAVERGLDWSGDDMRCDGMYRPEGAGIRLVFDEFLDDELLGLIIVIGVADARPGEPALDLPANVTIIEQSSGNFFSTREEPRCWTSFTQQLQLSGTITETWRIDGQLYCASALAALTGTGSITLADIEYSGLFKPDQN